MGRTIWENVFDCGRDRIDNMWFPCPGALPSRHDETISFQADEVCADGVVGEPKLLREFLDSSIALSKQAEYLSASAFDKPFTPWRIFQVN